MAASGFEHLMDSPQTAIGKGTVGEPPPAPPGKEGVNIKLSLFFDGTKNNRSNTEKRISQPSILSLKGDDSSYANFYSNVPILEYMNLRNKAASHEVSVYIEGIGTVDFSEELKAEGTADKDNGNDVQKGYAFGAGPTGIRGKVTIGINKAKEQILQAYDGEEQFIQEIFIDVFGFSRGAAAARHFVHRHVNLREPWPGQGPAKLTVNFVGLFETVSSYEEGPKLLTVAQALTEGAFDDDVKQLGLNLGATPNKVVHLTAADEMRENFSLTTIDSSLEVSKGIELSMPGVHSDIGGGYAEHAQEEIRRIRNAAEKQHLIAGGWYKPYQFKPVYEVRTPEIPSYYLSAGEIRVPVTPAIPSKSLLSLWEDGIRPLTNQYQYIPLYLMLDFAKRHNQKLAAEFAELSGEFAAYQVPAELVSLRENFLGQAQSKEGAGRGEIICPPGEQPGQLHWLRNLYLHRSHRSFTEFEFGMNPAKHNTRTVIDDRKMADKPSRRALNATGQGMQRARQAVDGAIKRAGQFFSRK